MNSSDSLLLAIEDKGAVRRINLHAAAQSELNRLVDLELVFVLQEDWYSLNCAGQERADKLRRLNGLPVTHR